MFGNWRGNSSLSDSVWRLPDLTASGEFDILLEKMQLFQIYGARSNYFIGDGGSNRQALIKFVWALERRRKI